MAGESESFYAVPAADAAKFGFDRPEMYELQSKLAGIVDPYDRHVFPLSQISRGVACTRREFRLLSLCSAEICRVAIVFNFRAMKSRSLKSQFHKGSDPHSQWIWL